MQIMMMMMPADTDNDNKGYECIEGIPSLGGMIRTKGRTVKEYTIH